MAAHPPPQGQQWRWMSSGPAQSPVSLPPALPRGPDSTTPSLEMSPASGFTCSPRAQIQRNYTTNYTAQILGLVLTPVSTQKLLIHINEARFIIMLNSSVKIYQDIICRKLF